jgi:4-hydroxymandelate oxidase
MPSPINLLEYETLARERLPRPIYDFIAGGAEDEVTLRANREAFQRLQLLPRALADVSSVDPSTTVLGTRLSFPVILAPVALHKLANPQGELATARTAAAAGTVVTLSTMSSYRIEEVAAASDGPKWFQLYVHPDREITKRLVARAEEAGFSALVLTVDVPRLGRREADFRNQLTFPEGVFPVNYLGEAELDSLPVQAQGSVLAAQGAVLIDPALSWRDVDWLRSVTSMPLLLKGVLHPEDALIALEHGVAGIIVSNHGGRQLDTVPAAIDVLPEIVEVVAGRVELLVDGGIRRGTDVLKALALGASAVLIGRPYIWGLAVGGESGVSHVLSLLRTEFEMAMALTGCASVSEITPGLVRRPQAAP